MNPPLAGPGLFDGLVPLSSLTVLFISYLLVCARCVEESIGALQIGNTQMFYMASQAETPTGYLLSPGSTQCGMHSLRSQVFFSPSRKAQNLGGKK